MYDEQAYQISRQERLKEFNVYTVLSFVLYSTCVLLLFVSMVQNLSVHVHNYTVNVLFSRWILWVSKVHEEN